MTEYVIHVEDAKTLYGNTGFPFPLDAYLREKVVRCRDCKRFPMCDLNPLGGDVNPDGFCAWGEIR